MGELLPVKYTGKKQKIIYWESDKQILSYCTNELINLVCTVFLFS